MKTKTVISILTLALILGCQKDEILFLKQKGYVALNGSIQSLSETSKEVTPPCTDKIPVEVQFVMYSSENFLWSETRPISIVDNAITTTVPAEFPIDDYTVEDVLLRAADGTITHAIPHWDPDPANFNFGLFVRNPLPFIITVNPEVETLIDGELLCYTSQILDLNGTIGGLKIIELKSLYYEIPVDRPGPLGDGCIDWVTIDVLREQGDAEYVRIYDKAVIGKGIRGTPIYKEFAEMVISCYQNGVLQDTVTLFNSNYNLDENPTNEDVIRWDNACN